MATPAFTPKTHRHTYEAINPKRPSLSQKGRTILITGGASGIGYAISRAFAVAGADRVIILGRRADAVAEAAVSLRAEVAAEGNLKGEIQGRVGDISSLESIDALWDGLAAENITVDVVVLNAASFSKAAPVLEIGVHTLLEDYRVNVLAGYRFAQRLKGQEGGAGGKKYLLNVSSIAAHDSNTAPTNLNYGASKNAAALLFQLMAREVPAQQMQIISFHPGAVLTEKARAHGYTEDTLPWDDVDVPAHFSVWAASEEASFLHGRFVHATWDVGELMEGEKRALIDGDLELLKIGVKGL
ncbi:SDR family NAD(P)-dependent oxidoreductase [Aspergillus mulundensis]|uniref:Short-chain dehydrogenase n=1 Tax=Aspergillus mulundensis TaxID=1810919 RepID=A0A3D8R997_9EURO|nr:Uncharacterized protein DSM5745_08067 [Aspergillus mulundensis]RDW70556.1 Uncharacterized protein DSM5745_08067 [Aspergillus mulundensis]